MNYIHRYAEAKFLKLEKTFAVVLVCGPRQVGKTTMLKYLSENQNRTYVTLDDLDARNLAINDPKLFFQKYKTPIIIDEVQYAPNLFSFIKIMADKNQKPGEFWLTGSQSYEIMKNVSESLAGRIGLVNMFPMTYEEICQCKKSLPASFDFSTLSKQELNKLDFQETFMSIFNGGMPKTIGMDDEMRFMYFKAYVGSYLMLDVMQLGQITDAVKFNKFLSACASQVSNVVNFANLALASDISQPTAKEWLKLLQGLGIVYLVYPYSNNLLKRFTKTPKLYFYDTGLCAFLAKIPSQEILSSSAFAGAYFENFVMNLFKIKIDLCPYSQNLYFYRDTDKHEIDILIEAFDGVVPLEVKLSASPNPRDLNKFKVLDKLGDKKKNGGIICLAPELLPISETACFIPVGII